MNEGTTQGTALAVQKAELPQEMKDKNTYQEQLAQLPEVKALTDEINIDDKNSILKFGQRPAEQASRVSDEILAHMQGVKQEEVTEMMSKLNKLIKQYDMKDLEDLEKKGILEKVVNKAKSKIDKIFDKYNDLGKKIDEIVQLLRKYQADIDKANAMFDKLRAGTMSYYHELEKYIVAGRIGKQEIEDFKPVLINAANLSEFDKNEKAKELDRLIDALDKRVYDLSIAENLAMQTCPMITMIQDGNMELSRQIESALITTIPAFKIAIIQAIELKRQEIRMNAMKDIKKTTEQLWAHNAKNAALASTRIAELGGSGALDIETLKQSLEDIKQGIADTERIAEQKRAERAANTQELERLKKEMKESNLVA